MKTKILLISMTIFMSFTMTSQILNVPGDYNTIQNAINASQDGDTVLVADGSYFENINFKGKAITVASNYLLDGKEEHILNTKIKGSNPDHEDSASVVMFISGEDTTSILNGFTITSGTGLYLEDYGKRSLGGGIACLGSGAKILNCRIINNTLLSDFLVSGGGIGSIDLTTEHWLVVENCEINNNDIRGNAKATGGGIYVAGNCRVNNSEINENYCHSKKFTYGGGVMFESPQDTEGIFQEIQILNSIINDNICQGDQWTFGGGVYTVNCHVIVVNNEISYNLVDSGFRGVAGGITIFSAGNVLEIKFNENTLIGNECYGLEDTWGAAVNLAHSALTTEIKNNYFEDNVTEASNIAYGTFAIYVYSSEIDQSNTQLIFDGNIFQNNTAGLGGAICAYNTFNIDLTNNLFYGNEAATGNGGALYFYETENKMNAIQNEDIANHIFNNTITSNGLYKSEEEIANRIFNNTFVLNDAYQAGGAISTENTKSPFVAFNNIFWDNDALVGDDLFNGGAGDVTFIANSIIDNSNIAGSWTQENNFEEDPMLNDEDWFHLTADSPAINAGVESIIFDEITYYCPDIDIDGDPRPIGNAYDIGADEYLMVDVFSGKSQKDLVIEVSPNPFRENFNLKFKLNEKVSCQVYMYNSNGELVDILLDQTLSSGDHELNWNSSNIPSGLYYLRLIAGNRTDTKSLIKLN